MSDNSTNSDRQVQSLQVCIQQLKDDNESLLKIVEANKAVQDCLETENQKLRTENTRLNALIAVQNDFEKERAELNSQISTLTTRAETAETMSTSLNQQTSVLRQKMHTFLNKQKDFVISSLFDGAFDQSDETPRKRPRTESNDDLTESEEPSTSQESRSNELSEMQKKLDDANKKIEKLQEKFNGCKNSKERVEKELDRCREAKQIIEKELYEILNKLDPKNKLRNAFVEKLDKQAREKIDRKQQYKEALNDYLKLVDVEESGRKNVDNLGLFWNQISVCWDNGFNDLTKAFETIEKAIQYWPNNAVQFHNRACYHERLNNKSKAIEDLKKAIELDPNHELSKKFLTRLEKQSSN